uniref:Peroxidase n=1 Tax=Syphacia muris TaxID=451379 RepID=A0A0N5AVI9_9BILA
MTIVTMKVLMVIVWSLSLTAAKCPESCSCNAKVTLCRNKALKSFPVNISADTVLLDLRNNLIRRISKADLNGLRHLEVLLISRNHIRFIDQNVLDEVPKLKRLYLSQNRIEQMPILSSKTHKNLNHLDLHTNRILKIPDNFLHNFIKLHTLDLSNNYLQTVSENILRNAELQKLYLGRNPLNCDCRFVSRTIYTSSFDALGCTWIRIQAYLKHVKHKSDLLCHNPHHLRNQNLMELDSKRLRCHKTTSKIVGNLQLIICPVSGHHHTIDWLYRQRNLDEEYNGEYEILSSGKLSVSVSADPKDFQCAINHYINPERSRRQSFLSKKPRFLVKPKSRSYSEGSLVKIVCQAIGNPKPSINWFFNDTRIGEVRKYELSSNKTTLIIFPFLNDDAGRYTCIAENDHGWIEASADISLFKGIAPEIVQVPSSVTVTVGETAMFKCSANAESQSTIFWNFNNRTVQTVEGHYQTSYDGTILTVENIKEEDSGIIQCVVKNSVGSATADAEIIVQPAITEFPVFYQSESSRSFKSKQQTPDIQTQDIIVSNHENDKELLKWLKFAKTVPSNISKTREVYEESIELIRKLVSKGLILDKMSKAISFDTSLPQSDLDSLIQLSGCSATQIKDSCSDKCFHDRYRTIDGQCNNRAQTSWGASHTSFKRLLRPAYENGFNTPIGFNRNHLYFGYRKPNPRIVSKLLFEVPAMASHENLSSMVIQWGEFIGRKMKSRNNCHDISQAAPAVGRDIFTEGFYCNSTCENKNPCFNIQLPTDDPKLTNREMHPCLEYERSSPVCGSDETSLIYGQITHREQMNTITSFIDGSAIYGSTDEDAFGVRDFDSDGLLRYDISATSRKPFLPFDTDAIMNCKQNGSNGQPSRCFLAGDVRANEQLGLLSLHTIMMREHNRVAMRFAQQNPRLNKEVIFQESRKIVGAEIQHITFSHWLPKILGSNQYKKLIGPYTGYDPNIDPSVSNVFATAAFRFGHLLANPILHRYDANHQPFFKGHIPLHEAHSSPETIVSDGIDPIIRGLFASPIKRPLRYIVNSEFTEELFKKTHHQPSDSLGPNVLRYSTWSRSRTSKASFFYFYYDYCINSMYFSYTEYRKWCNLTTINRWEDLRSDMNESVIILLRQIYGHPDNIDLFVGGMTENTLPESLVGPTFACIIADQFQRLRKGDRFWYENKDVFTTKQLQEIKKASLARIICDNSDDIKKIQASSRFY